MKVYETLLSLALAFSVVSTANAANAKRARHHAAHAAKASTTDWPGNPYMDRTQAQVDRFWRDAFNPWGATAK